MYNEISLKFYLFCQDAVYSTNYSGNEIQSYQKDISITRVPFSTLYKSYKNENNSKSEELANILEEYKTK